MVTKEFKGFRFDSNLYGDFKKLASKEGTTVTAAFERFMTCCITDGALSFPKKEAGGFEAEARVLIDWLSKGKHFYRNPKGEEINICGRLIELLGKVSTPQLRLQIEEALKKTVTEKNST